MVRTCRGSIGGNAGLGGRFLVGGAHGEGYLGGFRVFGTGNSNHDDDGGALQSSATPRPSELEALKEEMLKYYDIIKAHDVSYYELSKPTVEDWMYDEIREKYAGLVNRFEELGGDLGADGRFRFIGGGGSGGDVEDESEGDSSSPRSRPLKLKHVHLTPMLSLSTSKTHESLRAWLTLCLKACKGEIFDGGGCEIVCEPKLDGVSLSLVYKKVQAPPDAASSSTTAYELSNASTRGNGASGTSVKRNLYKINGVPDVVQLPTGYVSSDADILEVRGEVIMGRTVFEKILNDGLGKENGNAYNNARNAASGMLQTIYNDDGDSGGGEDHSRGEEFGEENIAEFARSAHPQAPSSSSPSTSSRPLDFVCYQCCSSTSNDMSVMKEAGFQVPSPTLTFTLNVTDGNGNGNDIDDDVENDKIVDSAMKELVNYHKKVSKIRPPSAAYNGERVYSVSGDETSRGGEGLSEYEMDGVVFKVKNENVRRSMGDTSTAPRWAIAYKFPPSTATTKILSVSNQVGRTGVITPVAELSPVKIRSVYVRRATLHNYPRAKSTLEGCRIGDDVVVSRAGDVIPQIVTYVKDSAKNRDDARFENRRGADLIDLEPPKYCPGCGSSTRYRKTILNDCSKILSCSNGRHACPAQKLQCITYSMSKSCLDVDGVSKGKVKQLVENGVIDKVLDFFTLAGDEEKVKKLKNVKGWGEVAVNNLIKNSESASVRSTPLENFINSLCVDNVGYGTSRLLASKLATLEEFINQVKINEWSEYLQDVGGIGQVVSLSLAEFSKEESLVNDMIELSSALNVADHSSSEQIESLEEQDGAGVEGKVWRGVTVAFTGKLQQMTRSEAKVMSMNVLGAKTTDKINKKTDVLVIGDKVAERKIALANKHQVDIVSEDDFYSMLEEVDKSG